MQESPATRTSPALWGTAHLAWGVAIFASLVLASQQLPVPTQRSGDNLAQATFFVGLVYLAIVGWLQVDRGWKLRRPTKRGFTLPKPELLGYLASGGLAAYALLRAEDSQLLASGLDRLASAVLTVSALSAFLWLATWLGSAKIKPREPIEPLHWRMSLASLCAGGAFVGLAAALEWLSVP